MKKITKQSFIIIAMLTLFAPMVGLVRTARGAEVIPQVTNLTDTSVTIVWTTATAVAGEVRYGLNNPTQTGYDQRGQAVSSQVHSVVLTGLTPNSSYLFDVVSGGAVDNNNGQHYRFTTGATLPLTTPDTAYGQVKQAGGVTAAAEVLVMFRVVGANGTSAWLSALTEASGYWLSDLSGARTTSGAAFSYGANDQLEFQLHGGNLGELNTTLPLNPHAAVPDLTLAAPVATVKAADCNRDGKVDAGDISATILEIFDGDGNQPANAPSGTFAGDSLGCNANQDTFIDAGDISCTILTIFNGAGACQPALRLAAATGHPTLTLGQGVVTGNQLTVPVVLNPNGNEISSLVFALQYDNNRIKFNSSDLNQDGLPDAVKFATPSEFDHSITLPGQNISFMVSDMTLPLKAMPAGTIATLTFEISDHNQDVTSAVQFATEPSISFGNTTGQSVGNTVERNTTYLPLIVK